MNAVAEARKIQAWADEDPARAAEGLAKIAALKSAEPEVRDIAELLAMTADAVEYMRTHPEEAPK